MNINTCPKCGNTVRRIGDYGTVKLLCMNQQCRFDTVAFVPKVTATAEAAAPNRNPTPWIGGPSKHWLPPTKEYGWMPTLFKSMLESLAAKAAAEPDRIVAKQLKKRNAPSHPIEELAPVGSIWWRSSTMSMLLVMGHKHEGRQTFAVCNIFCEGQCVASNYYVAFDLFKKAPDYHRYDSALHQGSVWLRKIDDIHVLIDRVDKCFIDQTVVREPTILFHYADDVPTELKASRFFALFKPGKSAYQR